MKWRLCGLALLGVVAAPIGAFAAELSIEQLDAATAVDLPPFDGVFDRIVEVPDSVVFVSNSGEYAEDRAAVEWDLSVLPTDAHIRDATVEFVVRPDYLGFPPGFERVVQGHGSAGDGKITLEDFSVDGLLGTSVLGPIPDSAQFDVTDLLQSLVSEGERYLLVNVREELKYPGIPDSIVFDAQFGAPYLTVSWDVPEPGTLALLSLGLAGIGFARRRKA